MINLISVEINLQRFYGEGILSLTFLWTLYIFSVLLKFLAYFKKLLHFPWNFYKFLEIVTIFIGIFKNFPRNCYVFLRRFTIFQFFNFTFLLIFSILYIFLISLIFLHIFRNLFHFCENFDTLLGIVTFFPFLLRLLQFFHIPQKFEWFSGKLFHYPSNIYNISIFCHVFYIFSFSFKFMHLFCFLNVLHNCRKFSVSFFRDFKFFF